MPGPKFEQCVKQDPIFCKAAHFTGEGFDLVGEMASVAQSSACQTKFCYTLRYPLGKQFVAYEHVTDEVTVLSRYKELAAAETKRQAAALKLHQLRR